MGDRGVLRVAGFLLVGNILAHQKMEISGGEVDDHEDATNEVPVNLAVCLVQSSLEKFQWIFMYRY